MANYSSLKSAITSVIKTNGNKEITGAVLQSTLLAIVNSIGDGFIFKGIAVVNTNPGTPDQNVFYIGGPGTYVNFNNLVIQEGYVGALKYNGTWSLDTVRVGDINVVKYEQQSLTNSQKEQARTNIDAASSEELTQVATAVNGGSAQQLTPSSFVTGKALSSIDGSDIDTSATTYRINDYSIEGGKLYLISGRVGVTADTCLVAFFNGNTFISSSFVSTGTATAYEREGVTAPANATRMRVCGTTSDLLPNAPDAIGLTGEGLIEKVEKIENSLGILSDTQAQISTTWVVGQIDLNSGQNVSAQNAIRSDFLSIQSGGKIRIVCGTGYFIKNVYAYNSANLNDFYSLVRQNYNYYTGQWDYSATDQTFDPKGKVLRVAISRVNGANMNVSEGNNITIYGILDALDVPIVEAIQNVNEKADAINEDLQKLEYEHITDIPASSIVNTGKFLYQGTTWGSTSGYDSALLDVSQYRGCVIDIQANGGVYAFLTTTSTTGTASFANGYTRPVQLIKNQIVSVYVPLDAAALYIQTLSNSVNTKPSGLSIKKSIKGHLDLLGEKITVIDENLEMSGGLAQALYTRQDVELLSGSVVQNGGAVGTAVELGIVTNASTAAWKYKIMGVSPGQQYYLDGFAGSTYYFWTIVNANNVVLATSGVTNANSRFSGIVTIPEGAKKMAINISGSVDTYTVVSILKLKDAIKTPVNTYGYRRQYQDITFLSQSERKTVSGNTFVDSTTNVLKSLPNNGVIEIKMNAPVGKFKIYKKTSSTITELTSGWSNYQYRFVGDYLSEYYALVALQAETTLTIDSSNDIIKVYQLTDIGTRYDIDTPLKGKNVAFFGDSIVQGRFCKFGTTVNMCMAAPYSNIISGIIDQKQPANFGIGGATVYNADWKSLYLNCANISGYDYVFVCAGTNDYGNNVSSANFTTAFRYVISTLVANNTNVVVVTPVPRTNRTGANTAGLTLRDYATIETSIAEEYNCAVVDLLNLLDNNTFKQTLTDGLHPDETGHNLIAETLLLNFTN